MVNRAAAAKYLCRKIKTLYIPFAVFNIGLLLLNPLFISLHLISPESALTGSQTFHEIVRIVLFLGGIPELGSPTWFIRTLFLISVGHLMIEYFVCRVRHGDWIQIVLILCCMVAAQVLNQSEINAIKQLHTCFSGYIAYCIGLIWRKYGKQTRALRINIPLAVVCMAALIGSLHFGGVDLYVGRIVNILFYLFVSFAGWIMIWCMAACCPKRAAEFFTFLGRRTMPILLFHLLAFKLVSFLYILFTHGSMKSLADGKTPPNASSYLWVAYLVVGIAVPLALRVIFEKIRELAARRLA